MQIAKQRSEFLPAVLSHSSFCGSPPWHSSSSLFHLCSCTMLKLHKDLKEGIFGTIKQMDRQNWNSGKFMWENDEGETINFTENRSFSIILSSVMCKLDSVCKIRAERSLLRRTRAMEEIKRWIKEWEKHLEHPKHQIVAGISQFITEK